MSGIPVRRGAVASIAARAGIALAVLVAIVTAGLLRSYHEATPRLWPGAPAPLGSLTFAALVLLLALHLAQRRRGADTWPEQPEPTGPRLAQVVPLLVALLGEKWVSAEVLARAYEWIDVQIGDAALADAAYRLWTGLALLGTALLLLPVLRQVRPWLSRVATRERFATAALAGAVAALVTGAITLLLALAVPGARILAPAGSAGALLAATAAQVVRGGAEELYYRGLLQVALLRLLVRSGVPERRLARMIAIIAVSLGFTLEHVDPERGWAAMLPALGFVFGMSVALGTLFEVSRNLYIAMLAHTAVNLWVERLVPLAVDEAAQPLLPVASMALVFLTVLFSVVVVTHRRRGFA
ncbi:MAG: CPBP family intramembrane metalloprotease [Acidobacteria bacterium]|nr:CPBP family intramembrane metalloprotease [Acidobacteriota bacterium]